MCSLHSYVDGFAKLHFLFDRVENNCLPATFAIHRALKTELNVDNRIGATFGKVYCGIVGGVRRHEFACMGAPVSMPLRISARNKNIIYLC
jgi:hypothetical protein